MSEESITPETEWALWDELPESIRLWAMVLPIPVTAFWIWRTYFDRCGRDWDNTQWFIRESIKLSTISMRAETTELAERKVY